MVEPTAAELDRLQLSGVVSDNVVSWSDVPAADRARAGVWLEGWRAAAAAVCLGCSGLGVRVHPITAARVPCPVCGGAKCV